MHELRFLYMRLSWQYLSTAYKPSRPEIFHTGSAAEGRGQAPTEAIQQPLESKDYWSAQTLG
jgi:hypothetical protein